MNQEDSKVTLCRLEATIGDRIVLVFGERRDEMELKIWRQDWRRDGVRTVIS